MRPLWFLFAILFLLVFASESDAVPYAAQKHKRVLIREAHAVLGLSAPIAVLSAQIQAESSWRVTAESPVGAQGLTQFMPATARWMAELYPELGAAQPFNPHWAIRAMVRYDKWNYERVKGETECDRWWATLRSYNGGLGHWRKESRLASDPTNRHSVDAQCGNASRAKVHCRENLNYPRKILLNYQSVYASWGRQVHCDEECLLNSM